MLWFFRSREKRLMRNIVLGELNYVLGDTYYYPLESTVHISHIAQHAVAGERHAFLFEKQEARRQNARSGDSRHFERPKGVEKSPGFQHRKLTQITQIITENPVLRRIKLSSERITQSRGAATANSGG